LAFDLEASLNFEGNSGPYLQYTYARANRMLFDAGKYKRLTKEQLAKLLTHESELELLRSFYMFSEVVIDATKTLSPNILTSYLFDLAQKFNSFYKQQPILKEEDSDTQAARLTLTQASAKILQKGLYLLGIKTVERM
ncbi:MAG: DALR anticodon-binding domain-containing protein, partial [Candidatus Dojkabacteria bacterium]